MKKLLFILGLLLLGLGTRPLEAQNGWSLQTNPISPATTNIIGKVQFVSPTEGWISVSHGQLLHTTDAGRTWNIVVPFPNDTVGSLSDPAIAMTWVDQTHGWKINFIGDYDNPQGAVIYKTIDGGIHWTKKILSTTAGDMGVQTQFVDDNNGWALVFNFSSMKASLFRTTDGGNNWNPIEYNGVFGIFNFVDANNGWSITRYAPDNLSTPEWSITHTNDGGLNWTVQYTDIGNTDADFLAIQFTDLKNGWVVGDSAKILKTTDGGNNWSKITNAGISAEAKSKCLFFLDAATGWIGTNNGVANEAPERVILYTTNGGASWTKQYPPVSGGIFSIFFWDANNGWFTGEECLNNCEGPDSLKVWNELIAHTTRGGVTGVDENNNLPTQFLLSQNYPNPFNPKTTIKFVLPKEAFATLEIYNNSGEKVAHLVSKNLSSGDHYITWDASEFASGVYFYRLQTDGFVQSKKLVLLK